MISRAPSTEERGLRSSGADAVRQIKSLGFKIVSVALTFATAKVVIELEGTGVYGEYVLLHGYTLFAATVIASGPGILFLRELASATEAKKANALLYILPVMAVLGAGWLARESLTHTGFSVPLPVMFAATLYCFAILSNEGVRALRGGNYYIFFTDVTRVLAVVGTVVLAPGLRPSTILLASALVMCFSSCLCLVWADRGRRIHLSVVRSSEIWRHARKGMELGGANGLQVFKGWMEIFFAGAFLGPSQVAFFSVCQKLAKVVNLPLVSMNADIARRLATSIDAGDVSASLRREINRSRVLGVAFALVAGAVSTVYLEFYGFSSDALNVSLLLGLVFGTTLNVLFGPIGLFAQLSGLGRTYLATTILALVLSMSFVVVALPVLGVTALVVSNVLNNLVWNASLWYAVRRQFGLSL